MLNTEHFKVHSVLVNTPENSITLQRYKTVLLFSIPYPRQPASYGKKNSPLVRENTEIGQDSGLSAFPYSFGTCQMIWSWGERLTASAHNSQTTQRSTWDQYRSTRKSQGDDRCTHPTKPSFLSSAAGGNTWGYLAWMRNPQGSTCCSQNFVLCFLFEWCHQHHTGVPMDVGSSRCGGRQPSSTAACLKPPGTPLQESRFLQLNPSNTNTKGWNTSPLRAG